jgi:hypothetical protein
VTEANRLILTIIWLIFLVFVFFTVFLMNNFQIVKS